MTTSWVGPSERPAWIPAVELGGIAATSGLFALGAYDLALGLGVESAVAAATGALLGYVLADLAGGVVHWACDRVLDARAPVLGPWLVLPFLEHHRDPTGIAQHPASAVNGYNCLAVLPLLAALIGAGPASPGAPGEALARAGALGFALGVALTNQFHQWAHRASVPAFVSWLQRRGLILSPEHHGGHHTGHFADHYCVTTGWLNPLLDRTGAFSRAERLLRR